MKNSVIVSFLCASALALPAVTSCRRSEPSAQAVPAQTVSLSAPSAISARDKAVPSPSFLRIIAPVRLSCELGDALDSQVAGTREILEWFQKAGFNRSIWAVNSLPVEDQTKQWAEKCLKAFPAPPILAPDIQALGKERTGELLKLLSSRIDSVIVNFPAAEEVELVRNILPKTFIWLAVDLPHGSAEVEQAAAAMAEQVDGFYVNHPHEWNAPNNPTCAAIGNMLLTTGRPVIRGGFQYTCPRARPGLEEDLAENYRHRLAIYEQWLRESGHAGYAREIGMAIPSDMSVNREFAVALAEPLDN